MLIFGLIVLVFPVQNLWAIDAKPGYVIISSQNQSYLKDLISFRESQGLQVHFIDASYFKNMDGQITPFAIRDFLKIYKEDWRIKYLLIVGSINTVPMFMSQPNNGSGHKDVVDTPTDYFYAVPSANWDKDGDGRLGEYPDDGICVFEPEIAVGRIPLDQPSEIYAAQKSIVNFDSQSDALKSRTLFAGSLLGFKGESWEDKICERIDGGYFSEQVYEGLLEPAGFSRYRLYEKEGFLPSPYQCEESLTSSTFSEKIKESFGLVLWEAHGSSQHIVRTVWPSNSASKKAPDSSDLKQPKLLDSTAMMSQTTGWGVVLSGSCSTSTPEVLYNLGAACIKSGVASYVGSTRIAWSPSYWRRPEDGGMDSILWLFCKNIIKTGMTTGEAMSLSLYEFGNKYFFGDHEDPVEASQMGIFEFNLYGDPAVTLKRGDNFCKIIVSEPSRRTFQGSELIWAGTYTGKPTESFRVQVIVDKADMIWATPQITLSDGVWEIKVKIPKDVGIGKRKWFINIADGNEKFRIPISLDVLPRKEVDVEVLLSPENLAPKRSFNITLKASAELHLTEFTIKYNPFQLQLLDIKHIGKRTKEYVFVDNYFGMAVINSEGKTDGEILKLTFKISDNFIEDEIFFSWSHFQNSKGSTLIAYPDPVKIKTTKLEIWRSKADFNDSGYVDDADLGLLIQHIGLSIINPLWETQYDLNEDGKIDLMDYFNVYMRFSARNDVDL